jgi:ribosome-associated protein
MGLRLTMIKIPSRAFVRRQSASIEESLVRARLERLAGKRLTREGVLVINARRHRTQERNREDARECLFDLIRRAAVAPRARRSTKVERRRPRAPARVEKAPVKGLRRTKPSLD